MKGVITVIGKDRTGIIAEISGLLYSEEVNIGSINQAIMDDLFTMVMIVDLKEMINGFDILQHRLNEVAHQLKVDIRIQKEEIFNRMHML